MLLNKGLFFRSNRWGGVPLCGACTEQHYREALEVKGWEWHRDDGEEVRMWMRAHAASLPPPPPV